MIYLEVLSKRSEEISESDCIPILLIEELSLCVE